MKNFKKFLGSGAIAAVIGLFGVTQGFAQGGCDDVEGQTESYTQFTANFQSKDPDKMQLALDAGKVFLEKYGACEDLKQQTDYIKPWVPRLETNIPIRRKEIILERLFARFDDSIKAKNTTQIYAVGREILAADPGNPNVIMVMGGAGFVDAAKEKATNVDDAIRYAKTALDFAKNPTTKFPKKRADGAETAGAFDFEYSRKEAVDQMTYILGYLQFYANKDKKSGLPYYFELTQTSDRFKADPTIYAAIGSYYTDEAQRIGKEITPLITKLNDPATPDEEKIELDKQIKAKEAVYKAYEERTLDAFGRAYKVAKNTTPAEKKYRDDLYAAIQAIYKSRFPDTTSSVDAWLSTATAKPMPNPLSEVTPVVEEETTTSAAPAGAASGKTAAAVSRP